MEYRYLGRTGVRVSALCLGCLTFGRELDAAASQRIIAHYLEAGGNFLDTADTYSRGRSEEIVGMSLRGRRDEIVLATKVGQRMGDGLNEVGLSRKHIMHQIDESLRRLQTDHLDLYYLHCWDDEADLRDTLRTMDDLVRMGKVRSWGISNFAGWQMALAMGIVAQEALTQPIAVQPQYSLIVRDIEREVLPAAVAFGLAVVPWSPLARGLLSGKYRRGESPPQNSRFRRGITWQDAWQRWDRDRHWQTVEAVGSIAEARGKTYAQVALNWLLHRPGVTGPIIGATSLAQLKDNLGATGWELTPEEMSRLDEASALELGYPYEFMQVIGRDR